ncbi:MAG: hypothetical protein ACLRR6_09255 [Oscillospiraceae bacterium]
MPKKEKLPKQAKHEKQQKKRKGRSVQDFIGVKTFTKYGLMTQKGELPLPGQPDKHLGAVLRQHRDQDPPSYDGAFFDPRY